MSYILKHTAEELDHKLDLIDENKNLLPYPYTTNLTDGLLPAGLEDVGDGSILTTEATSSAAKVLLQTFVLLKGTYTASIEVVDIIDETKVVGNPGFDLEIEGATVESGQFTLSTETTLKVYLNIPAAFNANLLIKPMIRKADAEAGWVPNMDKIGTYVDRRFNSINAKFNKVIKADSIKVGSTVLTEVQLQKILNFIDSIELETASNP